MATAGYSGTPLPRSSGSRKARCSRPCTLPTTSTTTLGALPAEAATARPGCDRARRRRSRSTPAVGLRSEWPTLTKAAVSRTARCGSPGRRRPARSSTDITEDVVARTAAADRLGRQQGVRDRRHVERPPVRVAPRAALAQSACVAGTPREVAEVARRRRMRVHLAHVDRVLSIRSPVEPHLAAGAPVQHPPVRARPAATRSSRGSDDSPARCARTRPGHRSSVAGVRRDCDRLRSILAAVLTIITASSCVRSSTCAQGLSSVAHSTSQRYTLPTPSITCWSTQHVAQPGLGLGIGRAAARPPRSGRRPARRGPAPSRPWPGWRPRSGWR